MEEGSAQSQPCGAPKSAAPDARFTLDTSGVVSVSIEHHGGAETFAHYKWHNLPTDLVRGYIEAVLRDAPNLVGKKLGAYLGRPGYRHLHHSALAMILRDCEAYQHERDLHGPYPTSYWTAEVGADFWGSRQGRAWISFEPLTITLADDGKVLLAVAS